MTPSPSVWRIFLTYLRIGASAFGGPGMLPFIRNRLVDRLGWFTNDEFKTGLALVQSIPGGPLVQLAAYLGHAKAGLPGALAAFAGFALPAWAMITAFAIIYQKTADLPAMLGALVGLKVVVVAVCFMASLDFLGRYARTAMQRGLAGGACVLFLIGLKPFMLILGGAIIGVLTFKGEPRKPHIANGEPQSWKTPLALLGLYVLFLVGCALLESPMLRFALSMGKVDLLSFGGFGAFPMMYAEVVRARGWLDERTFMDAMAMSQVTPGPFLLVSAFVGYQLKGMLGAVIGGIAVFAPSFLMVMAAIRMKDSVLSSDWAHKALAGVLAILSGLILAVAVSFAKAVDWQWPQGVLLVLALAALARKVDILWVVLGGALASALLF
ncbi:chromate efflux transporter [Fundidesulfovibrio putealis]|uniref:chromate efflux transporter n=1 Tax=Fundidesulfovibrio putealis TaxID=270496 RepID=UPI00040CFF50|nr:chromate efflux transporter [Fundidesulfovibrio putealis]